MVDSLLSIYAETEADLIEWNKIISKRALNSKAEVEGTLLYVVIFASQSSEPVPQRKYFSLEKNSSYLSICINTNKWTWCEQVYSCV